MTVEDRVKRVIGNHFDLDPEMIKVTSELEVLGADSLDLIELLMALEEEFRIELPDNDEICHIATVKDVVRMVKDHLSHQGVTA